MRNLRQIIRALLFGFAGAVTFAMPARAQTARLPATPFGTSDFAKLRWLAGDWEGVADGEASVYQRYQFTDDSSAAITYYRDAGFTQESATGRLYLSVGRVYHTFGSNRWAATRIGADGLYFVPQVNARNSISWVYESPDSWTTTMRSGVSGHERVTVYHMKRARH
jgi:hypothetical protein